MLDVTNWADKNTWVCRAAGCGLVLPSRVKLVLHMRRSHALTALEYFREHKDSLTTDKYHKCQVDEATKIWTYLEIFLPAVLCKDSVGQLLLARPSAGEA